MPDGQTDDKTRVFLHDNYLEWCGEQDVPVVEDFGINLMKVEVKPWDLLRTAVTIDQRSADAVPSTKGTIGGVASA